MTDEQIKHMAQRFLSWKLPAVFHPDGGVAFERGDREPGSAWWPTGTNLLTYTQAVEMIRHMLEGVAAIAALDVARGESAGWRDIASAPHETRVLLAWRDWLDPTKWLLEVGNASWGQRFDNGYSNFSQHGQATHWRPVDPPGAGPAPAPETADERQAAIVAWLRSWAEYGQDAPVHQIADCIESNEWRRA